MTPPLDTRLLDALVDGALPEAERRALLLRLEAEPDGWRRCALAFLEAQAWREALGPLTAEAATSKPSRTSTGRRRGFALARAATVLAAFGMGWALSGAGQPSPVTPRQNQAPPIVNAAPTPPAKTPSAQAQTALASRSVADSSKPDGQKFTVEHKFGFLPIGTRNGRPVAVPVDTVRVRRVGRRTV